MEGKRGPLRRVVETVLVTTGDGVDGLPVRVWRERLECGHLQGIKTDLFGQTTAARRRCRQCT